MTLGELADLRTLVDTDARRALAAASDRSANATEDVEIATLTWITGLAQRALGDTAAARQTQEAAWSLAAAAGDRALAARVALSLAYDIAHGGDVDGASHLLDLAEPDVTPEDAAGLALQRGAFAYRLGRFEEAAHAFRSARQLARSHTDVGTELRALGNLGATLAEIGDRPGAVRALGEAIVIADAAAHATGAAQAHHNLAFVEARFGDLPAALAQFARATEQYERAHDDELIPRVLADHALALAEANLLVDAEELIERAVAGARSHGNEIELAEIELTAAEIDLARGAPTEAREGAAVAEHRFHQQSRERWVPVARLVRLRADARLTPTDSAVAAELVETSTTLARAGWRAGALSAALLAALLHAEAGRVSEAADLLGRFGRDAARARTIDRLVLARALAVLADRRGDRAVGRRALSSGLRVAATSQAALGALEMRAHAAEHGAALVDIGARWAVADGRPRELLERIEAMRSMMWQVPLVRPPDDDAMAAALAQLRRAHAMVGDPDASTVDRETAGREQVRLERTVRDLSRRAGTNGASAPASVRAAVRRAVSDVSELGDRQLIAYGNLDGQLLAVSVDRGRCRLHSLGPVGAVTEPLEACSFALHRMNRDGVSEASMAAAVAVLDDATERLARIVLPATVRQTDRPLVIVPTGALHGVPWGAMTGLAGRAVSVSPSLTGWSVSARSAAARTTRRHEHGHDGRRAEAVALLAGPDLRHADAEVHAIADVYDRPVILSGRHASAAASLAAIDTAELVHLACHGRFRSDNPLFSTLLMADGPINVYDLERTAMPEVMVLSACSIGSSTALTGGTLLGLASALGTFGAASVVASLVPVNDERLVSLMTRLHRGLADGLPVAAALADARARADRTVDPVSMSFVSIGA